MTSLLSFSDLFKSYKKWVSSNPQVVGDVETTVKWVSYFIAGRINSSAIISELIYSLSNLLVLFNDGIIAKSKIAAENESNKDDSETKLKLFLTTLEYCEVFIEITAKKVWGENGRWFFIFCVQLLKCIGRMLLAFRYKASIVKSPPITVLNRRDLAKNAQVEEECVTNPFEAKGSPFAVTLKRSGRVIRKVEGAPPIHMRNWKPVNQAIDDTTYVLRGDGGQLLTLAESIYILKPMLHLGSVSTFGLDSWKSYMLSLVLDSYSLRLYYNNRDKLTKEQKLELSKRCVSMLLYLMRSPFYNKYSKNKINTLVNGIANNVPITKAICNPILEYIPHWQNTYFYMWST